MKKMWVYDIEVFENFFCIVLENIEDDDYIYYMIHPSYRNDYDQMLEFLKKEGKAGSIFFGFNNISYDSQIVEHLIQQESYYSAAKPIEICRDLWILSNEVIHGTDNPNYRAPYPEYKQTLKQIDVFKLNHWDNMAKRSSLKWIQYTMDWHNIKESSISFNALIDTKDQIKETISYCVNDVKSTKKIVILSKDLIKLRMNLSKTYRVNLLSASEPKISKELFAYFLGQKLKMSPKDVKALPTQKRTIIRVNDIILPYVNFKTPIFKSVLEKFKTVIIEPENTKNGFKHSILNNGVKTDYGLGGIHGCRASGIYESTDDLIIMTSDVTSFYPNLAIRNKWSPGHLDPQAFSEQYEWFFEERKKIPKKDPLNYVYKLILNSTYGLSNDKHSFLYDPELTMRITINGQLSLTMLYEMISIAIPESIPLMQNTDGLETIIPRSKMQIYYDVCAEWEKITNLQLEHDTYQKLILADVNNYIAVYDWKYVEYDVWTKMKESNPDYLYKILPKGFAYASTKCKGRFEFSNLALHKNKSHLVIAKGVYNYFVHDMLPEEYIMSNKNIYDFCGGVKANSTFRVQTVCYNNGEEVIEHMHKITRYYISNKGCKLQKVNKETEKIISIDAGSWVVTVFNKFEEKPFEEYDVNYAYYLQRITREIESARGSQLTLLF